jgi:hypothetical protein
MPAQPGEHGLHTTVTIGVERRVGVVDREDLRAAHEHARDRDGLDNAARQHPPGLPHRRVDAAGRLRRDLIEPELSGERPRPRGEPGPVHGDVLKQPAADQRTLRQELGDRLGDRIGIDLSEVGPVNQHAADRRLRLAADQAQERRLARADAREQECGTMAVRRQERDATA